MRLERIVPGRRVHGGAAAGDPGAGADLVGAVLARDLVVAGQRWAKGRRLTADDLDALANAPANGPSTGVTPVTVTVLVPGPGDVHEDEAGLGLAAAVAGGDPGVMLRGPSQSRVDLVASVDGVVSVRVGALERLNRLDPLEVFTVLDGQVVAAGDKVASVKIGPHLVAGEILAQGERIARRGGPLVRVRPFRPVRIAVLVKEHITGPARERFEASVRAKTVGLGATLTGITYVPDELDAVTEALGAAIRGRPGVRDRAGAAIILAAGGASTDPADPFYLAVASLGGRIVRHGVPAHPGSMLWLGRVGRTAVVGLPSCGAFSRATAADLLLPRLVAGEPATAATVAKLGHGGILTRSQRFRFPAYARELDAPDG